MEATVLRWPRSLGPELEAARERVLLGFVVDWAQMLERWDAAGDEERANIARAQLEELLGAPA